MAMTERKLIVRNFGLFWDRENIHWGSPGPNDPGHLRGYAKKLEHFVDFREQRGIYVLYEGASIVGQRVVYIGQAGAGKNDLFHRLRSHRDDELWNRWQRFSWLGFLAVGRNRELIHRQKESVGNIDFSTALDQVEAVLIAFLEPLKNKQGPKWQGAREYLQWHVEPQEANNPGRERKVG